MRPLRLPRAARSALAATLAVASLPVDAAAQPATRADARPPLAEPSISPDRQEIAFVSGGDIWTVPADGGTARLLVSHAATESRPRFSPDGARIAFTSSRTGNGDIYVLTLASGDLRRLTWDDAPELLDGWSPDGRYVYLSTSSRDIAGMHDVLRIPSDGGTPMPVSADRYASEYYSAPSPDGSAVAFTARGRVTADWWRLGHSHIDESQIWVMRSGPQNRWEQVVGGGRKYVWPMWGADRRTLFYVVDDHGTQNLWRKPPEGAESQVTRFGPGRVLWPSISADGRTIVFERDFQIWRLDTDGGEPRRLEITLRGAPAAASAERVTMTSQFQELALAPDGRKVAFVVRGEVFAAASRDAPDATRVTDTPARERQVVWSPDSRSLVYSSERDGAPALYRYDFAARRETRLAAGGAVDPVFSPDGKQLAFTRGGRELCVMDAAGGSPRVVGRGYFGVPPFVGGRPVAWSPDGRWLAYLSVTGRQFTSAFVVPADGGEARQVSFLANVFGGSISWSPDGTYLLFDTGQRTEQSQLARVDLVPRTPKFREDLFRDLFRETPRTPATTPSPAPSPAPPRDTAAARASLDSVRAAGSRVRPVFEDIRRRLTLVPVEVDVADQVISPDGKTVLLIAGAAGQQNLYLYSLDELARETPVARQLTSTSGGKSSARFSPDGREVYYLENGRAFAITVENRQVRPLNLSAELTVDLAREKLEVFREGWTWLRDNFADSAMHGVDWEDARRRYEPWAAGARTGDELRRVMALMVGELNASHLGVNAPAGTNAPASTGRLGVRFDRDVYDRDGTLRVSEVISLSPAAVAGVRVGESIVAVDGRRVARGTNLDELLQNTIDRRVTLTLATGSGSGTREVTLRPINLNTEKGLLYRHWVEANRAYVARASNGRLGYVHMIDMGAGSLAQLHIDLDAENQAREGVVIDIRNNNGGFVNAYALDIFARRGYMTMTYRGMPTAPARTVLGQRSLEAPTVLVTNQHSLSDAEDFTEGYRALELGKVVGEPTAGWIIYTSNIPLVDGTVLRIPFITIRDAKGENMELKPRPVDVQVSRPIGESYTDRDSQLDAAVRELLSRIGDAGSKRVSQP